MRITVARYHTPSGRVIQRPYEKGKREDYYLEHLRRYGTAPDTLAADAPVYHTLRTGRTVYGGGGIVPDLFVAADTTRITPYLMQLVRRGVLNSIRSSIWTGTAVSWRAPTPRSKPMPRGSP